MKLDGLPSTVMPPLLWPWPLTFWLENLNSVSWDPGNLWPDLMKLAPIVTKILYSPGFSGHCLLWPWPLTYRPQNLISTSMKHNTSTTETGSNWKYGVDNVSCDAQNHARTAWHTRKQNAFAPVFGVGGIQPCIGGYLWNKTLEIISKSLQSSRGRWLMSNVTKSSKSKRLRLK